MGLHVRLLLVASFFLVDCSPTLGGKITVSSKAEATRVRRRIKATRFLDNATFGATRVEVEALVDRMEQVGSNEAFSQWIDRQFKQKPTYLVPLSLQMIADDGLDPTQGDAWVQRYRDHAFWHAAMAAPDQLRQRVAFALLQICVINDSMFGGRHIDLSGNPNYLAPLSYYDLLLRSGFNNYRAVLKNVTLHPCMGQFLSHMRNRKADPRVNRFPDENYAREVMQLFSIGLYEMDMTGTYLRDTEGNLIPTYDNEDIKAFARVFTGLASADQDNFWGWPHNSFKSMVMWEDEHDTDEKVLLNGQVLPAGQSGMDDINDAMDNLTTHPNIAPFVARRLIQRLTKSNPSRGYIKRVATVWQENRGDMKPVIKAILMDKSVLALKMRTTKISDDVWTVDVLSGGTEHSRFQEPIIRYTQFLRRFNATTEYPTGRFMISGQSYNWSQQFLRSPSVFNFYLPDFQPPGDIVGHKTSKAVPNGVLSAPEFEIYTSVTANRTANRYRSEIINEASNHTLFSSSNYSFKNVLRLDFSEEKELASDPRALVDHLDVLLTRGMLSETVREELIAALTEETDDITARTHAAIQCVLQSAQSAVFR
ncbi:MAG: DUF1800 family protein [Planctomycetaceae bacterium]